MDILQNVSQAAGSGTGVILMYVLVLVLFASIPQLLDIILAHLTANKTRSILMEKLIDKASLDKLEMKELQEFLEESRKSMVGMTGVSRATMALTVIVIMGIAVFHILVIGVAGNTSPDTNSQIINNVLSMLAGLLAAITGFYFGGRAAEKRT